MALKFNGTNIESIKFNGTALDKLIYNGVTVWENWVKKSGKYFSTTLEFEMNGTSTLTKTSSTFTPVKPTKLHLNWSISGRDWDGVVQAVTIEGLTESDRWITLWTGSGTTDASTGRDWYVNWEYDINVSEPIKQLRSTTSGRYWGHNQYIAITEWYQKGA